MGQLFIQTHPSWKTLVVHPMTRSIARHPWGAQRKEALCLSNPQTQPAASHTSLCFISGKRKHYHVFLSPLLCLPILTTSHKHFTEFLLRNLLWVDVDSVSFCLGEELVIVEKQVRVAFVLHDPSYLQNLDAILLCRSCVVGLSPAPADKISF